MCLRFVLPDGRIRQQSFIGVGDANVLTFGNPTRIKRQPALRTRIEQAGNLRRIGIVQVRKCSAGADHIVQGELIADADVSGVAQTISHRRDHREVWALRSTGYDSAG